MGGKATGLHDLLGCPMQIACTGVIAQPTPGRKHIIQRGRRECRAVWEPRQETIEVGTHGGQLRLLKHDLGEPDPIGVRRLTRCRVPGQAGAPMLGSPGHELAGKARARPTAHR